MFLPFSYLFSVIWVSVNASRCSASLCTLICTVSEIIVCLLFFPSCYVFSSFSRKEQGIGHLSWFFPFPISCNFSHFSIPILSLLSFSFSLYCNVFFLSVSCILPHSSIPASLPIHISCILPHSSILASLLHISCIHSHSSIPASYSLSFLHSSFLYSCFILAYFLHSFSFFHISYIPSHSSIPASFFHISCIPSHLSIPASLLYSCIIPLSLLNFILSYFSHSSIPATLPLISSGISFLSVTCRIYMPGWYMVHCFTHFCISHIPTF